MNRFVRSLAETLEVPAPGLDDEFRALPGWCSLKAFGVLVLLENDWHAPTTVAELAGLRTVRDLLRRAFVVFAAGVLGVAPGELNGETAMGDIPAWDSVAHLRLVMEAEKAFGVAYRFEDIPRMRRLDDFLII